MKPLFEKPEAKNKLLSCTLSCMYLGEAAALDSVFCPACVQVKLLFEKAEAKNKLLSCTLYSAQHVFR